MANEETMQEEEIHSWPRLVVGDKRKTVSKIINIGSIPSRRGHKKANHGLSKLEVVKFGSVVPPGPSKQMFVQILDLDSSNPPEVTPSKPSSDILMTLLKSEGLDWERFQQAITNEDVAIYYDMSVKEFE